MLNLCVIQELTQCVSNELYSVLTLFIPSPTILFFLLLTLIPPPPPCSTSLSPPSILTSFTASPHPSPLCSSYVRWSHQMMILSASAPVPVSRPSGASVQGGHCPRAIQDSWDCLEIHCHGTCPNMRGGRGRVKTQCWTQQRGQWFVLQVKADDFLFLQSTKDSLNRWREIVMDGIQSSNPRNLQVWGLLLSQNQITQSSQKCLWASVSVWCVLHCLSLSLYLLNHVRHRSDTRTCRSSSSF